MKVAIMQPTYLPWMGYFALMDRVDLFVLLDSVQFSYQSWQHHNQIKTSQGVQRLTVPVLAKSKGRRSQFIYDVNIDESNKNIFPAKHLRAIEMNYAQAIYFQSYWKDLLMIMSKDWVKIAELNESLIQWGKEVFSINTPIVHSRELKSQGVKAELVANLCRELGAKQYVSPPAARPYIESSNSFQEFGIEVVFHDYNHPIYPQMHGDFVSHMSFIDLLFNVGPESLKLIREGLA